MNFTPFPDSLRKRFRFYNDRTYDTHIPDPLKFEWVGSGGQTTVRIWVEFKEYARNPGNELGFTFEIYVNHGGITVGGVVWFDTSQTAPEADVRLDHDFAGEDRGTRIDEDNTTFVKNCALSIRRDVEEWLRPERSEAWPA